jgi:broad specificity phosphatase PhoE
MCRVILIPTGPTLWQCQDRLEAVTGSPLAEQALVALERACAPLVGERVDAVYSGDAAGEQQAAKRVALALEVRRKIQPDLRELDYGLWQGLTRSEIRRRQPKLFRDWIDDPSRGCPPAGETFDEASERLWSAIESIVKRHKNGTVVLVLRPVMLALLRCRMDRLDPTELWALADRADGVSVYTINHSRKRLQTIGEPHGGT